MRQPLSYYLEQTYSFSVVPEPEGGFFIRFPDLPGCMTQVEESAEIAPMAEEIRTLWIETEYERGADIPLPSFPGDFSGKFVVRLPRSLHRDLAEMAEREGVSLNQHVVALLAAGDAQHRIETLLARLTSPHGAVAEPTITEPVAVGEPRAEATSAA